MNRNNIGLRRPTEATSRLVVVVFFYFVCFLFFLNIFKTSFKNKFIWHRRWIFYHWLSNRLEWIQCYQAQGFSVLLWRTEDPMPGRGRLSSFARDTHPIILTRPLIMILCNLVQFVAVKNDIITCHVYERTHGYIHTGYVVRKSPLLFVYFV